MNQPSTGSRFTVALVGALLVVGATWMVRHPSDATRLPGLRAPASVRAEDSKKHHFAHKDSNPAAGKATADFQLTVQGDDGAGGALDNSSTPAAHFRLTGTIKASQALSSHEFSWILPNGYRVVDGATSGRVPDLQPGESRQLTITIDRGSEPAQPIVLHVYHLVNSEPRGQVAQFDLPVPGALRVPADSIQKQSLSNQDYVQ